MLKGFRLGELTDGERSIYLSYFCLSVLGAWLAYVVSHRLVGQASLLEMPGLIDVWWGIAGAIGAAGALYLTENWLGHSGLVGLGKGAIACLAISLFAALIGGTLVLPFYGTMFGPLALAGTFFSSPFLAVIWVSCLIGAHIAYGLHRRERDSIFRASQED